MFNYNLNNNLIMFDYHLNLRWPHVNNYLYLGLIVMERNKIHNALSK